MARQQITADIDGQKYQVTLDMDPGASQDDIQNAVMQSYQQQKQQQQNQQRVEQLPKPVPAPTGFWGKAAELGTPEGDVRPGGWGAASRAFTRVGSLAHTLGPGQVYQGIAEIAGKPGDPMYADRDAQPSTTPGHVQRGISDVTQGVGKTLMTKFAPEAIMTPVRTALGLGAAAVGDLVGQGGAALFHAGRDTQQMVGDLTSFVSGFGLYKILPESFQFSPEAIKALRSSILKSAGKHLPYVGKVFTDPDVVAAYEKGRAELQARKAKKPEPPPPAPEGAPTGTADPRARFMAGPGGQPAGGTAPRSTTEGAGAGQFVPGQLYDKPPQGPPKGGRGRKPPTPPPPETPPEPATPTPEAAAPGEEAAPGPVTPPRKPPPPGGGATPTPEPPTTTPGDREEGGAAAPTVDEEPPRPPGAGVAPVPPAEAAPPEPAAPEAEQPPAKEEEPPPPSPKEVFTRGPVDPRIEQIHNSGVTTEELEEMGPAAAEAQYGIPQGEFDAFKKNLEQHAGTQLSIYRSGFKDNALLDYIDSELKWSPDEIEKNIDTPEKWAQFQKDATKWLREKGILRKDQTYKFTVKKGAGSAEQSRDFKVGRNQLIARANGRAAGVKADPVTDVNAAAGNFRGIGVTPDELSVPGRRDLVQRTTGLTSEQLNQAIEHLRGREGAAPVPRPPAPREGTPEAEAVEKAKQAAPAEEEPSPLADQLKASLDMLGKKIQRDVSGSRMNALPLDTLADLTKWGALRIAKGAVDFASWSAEMISNFGEKVRPHLQDLWSKAQEMAKSFMEERGSFSRKPIAGGPPVSPPKPRGYQFVSPNVEEGLDFDQAQRALGSERHAQSVKQYQDIDEAIPGLTTEHRNAVGDWADGAENSVVIKVYEGTPEDNRYSAARKGTVSDQKQVIAFNVDPAAGDSVYEFDLNVDGPAARELLSKAGIQYRTLESAGRDQTHVYVFDPGNQLPENLEKLQGLYGRPIKITGSPGSGEFLGGDTREAGREAFRQIIEGYESTRPQRGGALGPERLSVYRGSGQPPEEEALAGQPKPPPPSAPPGTPQAEAVEAAAGATQMRAVSELMETPLQLPGKGLVHDMGAALEQMVGEGNRLGSKSDPQLRMARAEEMMRKDVEYGLQNMPTSRGWYTKMVAAMEKTLMRFRPEFRGKGGSVNRALFKYVLGITSVGVNPTENFRAAMLAWDLYQRQGRFSAYDISRPSEYNPSKGTGLTHRANSYEDGLDRLNQVIADNGGNLQKAVNWLKTKHTVKELEKYWPKIPDKTGGDRYGSYIFGPKVGAFGSNLNGIHTELTADKWWTRSWNRWMGTVMARDAAGNVKLHPKTGDPLLQDDPRNEGERNLMRQVAAKVAGELGLDVDELQAVLWYTEQALYRAHGVRSASIGYDDASEIYFSKRGAVQPEEDGGDRAPPKAGGPVPAPRAAQRGTPKAPARVSAAGPKAPPARRRLAGGGS